MRVEGTGLLPRVRAHATLARVVYPREVKLLTSHLEDFERFAARLLEDPGSLAGFLRACLTKDTLLALPTRQRPLTGAAREQAMRVLVKDLNRVLRSVPLYEEARFVGIRLSPQTERALRETSVDGGDLPRLNRLLLSDAFTEELSPVDRESLILIVKPGITDDLPPDLLNYQRAQPSFPQETTLDQFFDEAQWESYRKLGEHIATLLFEPREPLPDQPSWHPAQWCAMAPQTPAPGPGRTATLQASPASFQAMGK